MSYRRITEEERTQIHRWKQEGKSNGAIAKLLERDKSTVGRELKRNGGEGGYRPEAAQGMAAERAKRPGPRRLGEAAKADIAEKLPLGWTPEIISGRARLEGRAHVCRETIYKHIYADARAGGTLWEHLPRAKRKRRRRCPRKEGRGRGIIPDRRMIDTRPPEAGLRQSVGHWEGDLVNGARGTGHLSTLLERKTRFALVGRTGGKEAGEVARAVIAQFGRCPPEALGSLTLDNGKEFAYHALIASQAGLDVYFAHPYHSWERGAVENVNGLIRRLHPKGSSFAGIGEAGLLRIESYLNDRPRKCLGWRTPREAMAAFLATPATPAAVR